MAEITNSFVAAIMNKDMDERIVPSNSYRDALNIDIDVSEGSDAGSAQNKLGNTKIGNLEAITGFNPVTALARTIGSTTNEKDNVIYWLIASDKFDGIYEFSEETGAIVRVLQSNKLTPSTPSKLNFSKSYIVTGFNFVDGFLYWSDGYNPPRKINISRAKSYSVDDDRIDDDIDVILEPPLNSPTIKLSNDIDKPNNIEEKFVYFAYRYKYIDNQLSSLSPFSAVAFNPKDFELDFAAGNNKSMVNNFNTATVTFKTGNRNVKEIQLIMRDTRNINASLVETFNKQDLNIDDNSFYSFAFNNNKTYTTITPDQISRLFDNVPLSAKAQEFVGNRIMYGNYTQFQNIDEPIDINLNYISVDNISQSAPIQTFKSDRDYEMAIVYLDKYGRMTTPLTSENNTIYIPATKSNKGNSLQLEIKNNPPSWATNYRLYIKQSKGQYYNIFPLYMYVSGEYRYFLINESDRDKIPVGDYLIFKSVSNGPTFSNKKYKVLELKPQLANFEGIQGAQAGLYFKVKANSNSDLSQGGTVLWYEDGYGVDKNFSADQFNTLGFNTNAVKQNQAYIENPIYYGDNNGTNILSVVNNNSTAQNDNRITIKADSATTFIWTNSINGSTGWSSPIAITLNTPIQVGTYFQVNFSAYPVFNDMWKINIRGYQTTAITNYFGGTGLFSNSPYVSLTPNTNSDLEILPGDIITISIQQTPDPSFTYSKTFYANAKYNNIEEWFVESGSYLLFDSNIGSDSNNISFRRGFSTSYSQNGVNYDELTSYYPLNTVQSIYNYPVYMVIRMQDAPGDDFNRASGSISIKRSENIILAETAPREIDIDIYHELSKTFNIYEGNHLTRWSYKDFTFNSLGTNLGQLVPGSEPTAGEFPHGFEIGDKVYVSSANINNNPYEVVDVVDQYNIVINLPFPGPGPAVPGSVSYNSFDVDQTVSNSAKIQINNTEIDNSDFNAWSYKNALETYRIRDDFNKPTLEYSLRAMATVDEYKRKSSKNSICYSGTYGENTNINRLNEFNLSNANFKYLDSEYGSIQKLHARDTNLVVFQEDKVSEVLYGKNLLSDSVGGGSIVSIQEVLGTQVAYPGEWGISLNPESFSKFGTDIYFSDSKRGIVLQMSGNQVSRISDNFMTDYFRDLMMSSQYTQKLGAYDPHNNLYTLSSNDISVSACRLELNRLSRVINYNTNGNLIDLFTITTDGAWDIELVDIGWGTNWVSGFTPNGFGSQDIDANISTNISLALRKVVFNVKYCTDKNIAFILTQSGYNKITVVTGVFNTVNE
jgi:hypothetical protein